MHLKVNYTTAVSRPQGLCTFSASAVEFAESALRHNLSERSTEEIRN